MSTIYLLFWPRDLTTSYNYGSQIQFFGNDHHVTFQNHLASPGTRIHSWQSSFRYGDTKQNPDLPLLAPETDYRLSFQVAGDEKQMYTTVDFFAGDEPLTPTNIAGLDGQFQVPADADKYRISLVNIHQLDLTFYYGMLMRNADAEQYDIQVETAKRMVIVTRKNRPVVTSQSVTLLRWDNSTKPLLVSDADRTIILFGTNWEWRNQDWQDTALENVIGALQPFPVEMKQLPIVLDGPDMFQFADNLTQRLRSDYHMQPILA